MTSRAPCAVHHARERARKVRAQIGLLTIVVSKWEKRLEALPPRIAELEAALAALDKTISLHPIGIDPETIKPRYRRVCKHGRMGVHKLILNYLRLADGSPLSTSEIVDRLEQDLPVESKLVVNSLVIRAKAKLARLVKDGEVRQCPDPTGFDVEYWALADVVHDPA